LFCGFFIKKRGYVPAGKLSIITGPPGNSTLSLRDITFLKKLVHPLSFLLKFFTASTSQRVTTCRPGPRQCKNLACFCKPVYPQHAPCTAKNFVFVLPRNPQLGCFLAGQELLITKNKRL
jgi:hypothetical protein